jgi:hypothetical protein
MLLDTRIKQRGFANKIFYATFGLYFDFFNALLINCTIASYSYY